MQWKPRGFVESTMWLGVSIMNVISSCLHRWHELSIRIWPPWAFNHQPHAITLRLIYELFCFLSSTGKRTQEIICVYTCIALMVINFYLIVKHFRIERLSAVIFSAICGILTADLGSGFVHWAADTWGSIELPVIGKVIAASFKIRIKAHRYNFKLLRTSCVPSENITSIQHQSHAMTG